MKVPDPAYSRIKEELWRIADERNWPTLSDQQKTILYEAWIRSDDIGGVLSRYMDVGNVRVYIKDTIIKSYASERIKDFDPILNLLNLPNDVAVTHEYTKPHGRLLADGRVICWGLSRDWKAILFAVFERAHAEMHGEPYAAVIMFPSGKCQQPMYRRMIESAAEKLGVGQLIWFEG